MLDFIYTALTTIFTIKFNHINLSKYKAVMGEITFRYINEVLENMIVKTNRLSQSYQITLVSFNLVKHHIITKYSKE